MFVKTSVNVEVSLHIAVDYCTIKLLRNLLQHFCAASFFYLLRSHTSRKSLQHFTHAGDSLKFFQGDLPDPDSAMALFCQQSFGGKPAKCFTDRPPAYA